MEQHPGDDVHRIYGESLWGISACGFNLEIYKNTYSISKMYEFLEVLVPRYLRLSDSVFSFVSQFFITKQNPITSG